MEDVKLCCRRTPSLLEFIGGQAEKLKVGKEAGKEVGGAAGESAGGGGAKKSRGRKKKTAAPLEDD